jgi:hypothetical protein
MVYQISFNANDLQNTLTHFGQFVTEHPKYEANVKWNLVNITTYLQK